jgi:hypothetical protein
VSDTKADDKEPFDELNDNQFGKSLGVIVYVGEIVNVVPITIGVIVAILDPALELIGTNALYESVPCPHAKLEKPSKIDIKMCLAYEENLAEFQFNLVCIVN